MQSISIMECQLTTLFSRWLKLRYLLGADSNQSVRQNIDVDIETHSDSAYVFSALTNNYITHYVLLLIGECGEHITKGNK
jgi:hypothetical protein